MMMDASPLYCVNVFASECEYACAFVCMSMYCINENTCDIPRYPHDFAALG